MVSGSTLDPAEYVNVRVGMLMRPINGESYLEIEGPAAKYCSCWVCGSLDSYITITELCLDVGASDMSIKVVVCNNWFLNGCSLVNNTYFMILFFFSGLQVGFLVQNRVA